ncbi:TerD family protein [Embleya sp. NBC_00896]|uniref:TerD family protein n=1 Tax=Embleya sp. NBC_00896 TaxID=2975961 RepID=UPI0038651883|nr:TerD family protein [Embleya sp. NBC_00896]
MQRLAKGQNVALSALSEDIRSVTFALNWADVSGTGDADASALLLDANGKVRNEDDFYFYNRESRADDAVQLAGKTPTGGGTEDRISVDLAELSAEVDRVVIAASRYAGASFGELDDLHLTLSDSSGEPIARFDIDDAAAETAFVFGELYRRSDEWKFRAVGQGYASGLAGLATDFGIDVADDEAEAEAETEAATTAVEAEPAGPTPAEPTLVVEPEIRPRRLRTAKKKAVLPKIAKPRLADDESWQNARVFSVSGLRNELEREVRATSILLAVMAQVPEFGRRITGKFNAPAGTIETFAEASFRHGDGKVRPDGIIKVARGGRVWTALVETKTGGNALKPDQVEAYIEVARRQKYEAVITLSNDLALDGEHPVPVDKRKLRGKVALRHLSWAEVAHEAHMLGHHQGVANPAHLWLLDELLYFLRHDNAGCKGFENMGAGWVPVREAITAGTLRNGDRRALQIAESWEKLVRQLCLRVGGELGVTVGPVMRGRRNLDAAQRRAVTATSLAEHGRLDTEVRIPEAIGTLGVTADLRTARIETSVQFDAPEQARQLTRVRWLTRQLDHAPDDLRIEAVIDGAADGPCELLKALRNEPALLVPEAGQSIIGFRITLSTSMGTKRGSEETGFIRSVDAAVDRFYRDVMQVVKPAAARAGSRIGNDDPDDEPQPEGN